MEKKRITGKWSEVGVPHKGWVCIDMEDMDEPSETCEMCESQEIRYVHLMTHPDYKKLLRVGCVCAGHMSEDYEGAKIRETAFKNTAQRKKNWLNRKWNSSARGNPYLNVDHFNIAVFQQAGKWRCKITDKISGEILNSKKVYDSENHIKLAAFDAMLKLKERRENNH